MRIVVDASVAIKWAVPETDTDAALALLDADCVVPDLFFPEVASVLWKKVRRGEITAMDADRAADTLFALDYDVVPSAPLSRSALALALEAGHPVYDFHYVALARQENNPFVTADERFVRLARSVQPAPSWVALVLPLAEAVVRLRGG